MLDVTVSLYQLSAARAAVEQAYEEVIVERWTPRSFVAHTRACKLYDYARRQWFDFDGNPTSASTFWK